MPTPSDGRVLLVGGSSHVGTMVTPYLREHYELRVLDLHPPAFADVEYVEGSIIEPGDVRRALEGMDTFVNLVMRSGQGGSSTEQSIPVIVDNYAVNTLGLHLLLYTAQELGIKGGVHTSTMSVHYRGRDRYPSEESVPRDSPSVYGLTKGLGELVCQYFARWFDMNLIALRITGPRTREQWLEERRHPPVFPEGVHVYVTDEEDLANAYLAALEAVRVGPGRFEAVFIAGDERGEEHNLAKARRLLSWEPRAARLL